MLQGLSCLSCFCLHHAPLTGTNSSIQEGHHIGVPDPKGSGLLFPPLSYPQPDCNFNSILHLKGVNHYVNHIRLQAVILQSVISLASRDFMMTLDLKKTSFHINVHLRCQRFLSITVRTHHLQFMLLPFSLSSASLVFTKVLQLEEVHVHFFRSLVNLGSFS